MYVFEKIDKLKCMKSSVILCLLSTVVSKELQSRTGIKQNHYTVIAKDQRTIRKQHKVIRAKNTGISKMNLNDKELLYNYNELLDEYFMQTDDEAKPNMKYNEKNEGKLDTEFITTKRDTLLRLWNLIKIWFLVYLIIAIPLWCTRGWYCCCLNCKFCKPLKTIEEAKKYLLSYPPGIFVINGKTLRYDPTERERDSYEEFEHFIRIL